MHPLTAALRMEQSDGHTLLDKPAARRAFLKGYQYDQASLDEALRSGDLVRVNGGLTSPETAKPEAVLGRWLALRRAAETGGTLSSLSPARASLNGGQVAAWGLLTSSRTAARTGLPGTGKTYLVSKLIRAALDAGHSVRALAPTGKAASVLSLKLDRYPVETIHKALGLRPGEVYNDASLEEDIIVIDETSMVDASLMAFLVNAISDESIVWFVGDPNQLPPVGAGWPFADMVRHQLLPVATLTEPQRQAQDNGILQMSYSAALGNLIIPNRNVRVVACPTEEVEDRATDIYHQELINDYPWITEPSKQSMLLSPLKDKKFDAATSNLNHRLSHLTFPDRRLRGKFTIGDRLLFTVNNYQYGFVNGELGTLKSYEAGKAVIENDFGFTYELSDYKLADWADWAYALTVHKAQGSESDVVILLLHSAAKFMYTKNLVYTALTRAKRELILVGDVDLLRGALTRPETRRTCLPYLTMPQCEAILARTMPTQLSNFGEYLK